jgi:hypothetical protein
MTEQKWTECPAAWAMLKFLQGKASDRKLWQFACASARELSRHADLSQDRWAAVDLAERYLEGQGSQEEVEESWLFAWSPSDLGAWGAADGVRSLTWYAMMDKNRRAWEHAGEAVDVERFQQEEEALTNAGEKANAVLLRDIIGNPFKPVLVEPAWLTPPVRQLAETAYKERELPIGTLDPVRLAVLADTLGEAGCANADILDHLPSGGRHALGCWAVDLVLLKE